VPQVRELQERIQRAAACTCLLPLGRDRLYRRYWLLPSAATLLVEDDGFGLTEDMLRPRPAQGEEELQEPIERRRVTWVWFGSGAQVFTRISNYNTSSCSAGSNPAPLHTCGPPVNRLNQWFCYTSEEQVEQLIEALNPRGLRESSLKEALLQERDRLAHLSRPRDTGTHTHTHTHRVFPGSKWVFGAPKKKMCALAHHLFMHVGLLSE